MTDKLKTLLHDQATIPEFDPVDLAGITTAGERRVRRRRAGAVTGGLAAVAVLAAAVASSLGGSGGDDAVDPAENPYAEPRVSWAVGSVIHYGDTEIEVGRPVDAYVYTGAGFVLSSGSEVWSVDADGTERVGRLGNNLQMQSLLGEGGVAAWMETTAAGDPVVVALDQRTGAATRFDAEPLSMVVGITGGEVWFQTNTGLSAGDLATGTTRDLESGPKALQVIGARSGVVVRLDDDGLAMSVGPLDGPTVRLRGVGGLMVLSPSARWGASSGTLDAAVYDTRTGKEVEIDTPPQTFAIVTSWLDDSRVVVASMPSAGDSSAPMTLLVCAVPEGTCTPEPEVAGRTWDDLVLPWGVDMGDDDMAVESHEASGGPHLATASPAD